MECHKPHTSSFISADKTHEIVGTNSEEVAATSNKGASVVGVCLSQSGHLLLGMHRVRWSVCSGFLKGGLLHSVPVSIPYRAVDKLEFFTNLTRLHNSPFFAPFYDIPQSQRAPVFG